MSLFSGKKTVVVSSVVYNLAGPEEDRPNFLKTVVLGNMLVRGDTSIGNSIVNNYINGPGLKLRSFYRWCENNYTTVGIPRDTFTNTRTLDAAVVADEISDILSVPVQIEWVEMAMSDATYWAIQWMYINHPEVDDDEWLSDYDHETGEITITFTDTMIPDAVITITGYEYGARYIYAAYIQESGESAEAVVTGSTDTLPSGDPFPSTAGWTLDTTTTTALSETLTTTVTTTVSYSDGRPDEVSSSSSDAVTPYDRLTDVYTKTTYHGLVGTDRSSTKEDMTLIEDYTVETELSTSSSSTVVMGVTVTTTVDTSEEVLEMFRTVRIDTQELNHSVWSTPELFIYKQGSGNATLDAMFVSSVLGDGYFPIIPMRLKNEFISDSYEPDLYEESKKAYKKIFDSDYDEMIEKLEDNPDLNKLDYVYIVFGVNLNTTEKEGIQYIYEYFHRLMSQDTLSTPTDMGDWVDGEYVPYEGTLSDYEEWLEEQLDIGDVGSGTYTPEPARPTFVAPPVTELRVKTTSSVINFDMQIDWDTIEEVTGTGEGKPGAQAGDLWITGEENPAYAYNKVLGKPTEAQLYKNQVLSIWWQLTDSTWKRLDILGLVHRNFVWRGKSVNTWGIEAILDTDESQFIVPLHYEVFKSLPMKVSTQLSTSCAHMVINVFEVHKEHWYASGIFKVFAFIAALVVTVISPSDGLKMFAALLGVTILVAAVIVVAASMIAAMILTNILTPVATALFGEKVGHVIAAIASFVLMVGTGVYTSTGSLAGFWQTLMNPINLLYLTNAIGNGIASVAQIEAMETAQKTQQLWSDYEDEMDKLAAKYKDVFGDGFSYIDPMSLTDSSVYGYESSETFLSRTLMTGSDFAELSKALLNDFTEITLRLDLPN